MTISSSAGHSSLKGMKIRRAGPDTFSVRTESDITPGMTITTSCDRSAMLELFRRTGELLGIDPEICDDLAYFADPRNEEIIDQAAAALRARHSPVDPDSPLRCPAPMVHPDKSKARCVLHRDHVLDDTGHLDEHGHRAPVLVSQAAIEEARYWQDIPLPSS